VIAIWLLLQISSYSTRGALLKIIYEVCTRSCQGILQCQLAGFVQDFNTASEEDQQRRLEKVRMIVIEVVMTCFVLFEESYRIATLSHPSCIPSSHPIIPPRLILRKANSTATTSLQYYPITIPLLHTTQPPTL
jgi:hypothetical protein